MSERIVIGIFDTYDEVGEVIEDLRAANFQPESISILGSDKEELRVHTTNLQKKGPDSVITTTSLVGAAGGWLVGLAAIAVPGIGPMMAAGPLMAALSGAAAGGLAGAIGGALIHFDVPEYEAKIYEGELSQGKVLVAVHTADRSERFRAEEIMDQHGAVEIDSRVEPSLKLANPKR